MLFSLPPIVKIDNKMSVSSIPAPQTPKPKPRFIFSDKSSVIDTYESFGKEGFAHILTDHGDTSANHARNPYEQEKKFLSQVDLSKGNILVKLESMVRIMASDLDSPKRERKEYFYYTTEWEAKDHRNNTIRSNSHTEGKFTKQTRETVTKYNQTTGKELVQYIRGPAREVYTIAWDKKKANELLTSEKIFGEDSINITNMTEVQYIVKFPYGNPARTAFGMQDFLDFKYEITGVIKNSEKSLSCRLGKES